jgi:hypothetical protein
MHHPDICRHANTYREWALQFEFTGQGETEEEARTDIAVELISLSTQHPPECKDLHALLEENNIPARSRSYLYCLDCGTQWHDAVKIIKGDATANTQAHQPH